MKITKINFLIFNSAFWLITNHQKVSGGKNRILSGSVWYINNHTSDSGYIITYLAISENWERVMCDSSECEYDELGILPYQDNASYADQAGRENVNLYTR